MKEREHRMNSKQRVNQSKQTLRAAKKMYQRGVLQQPERLRDRRKRQARDETGPMAERRKRPFQEEDGNKHQIWSDSDSTQTSVNQKASIKERNGRNHKRERKNSEASWETRNENQSIQTNTPINLCHSSSIVEWQKGNKTRKERNQGSGQKPTKRERRRQPQRKR